MYPETGTLIDYQQVQTACECIAMCNSNEHCIAVDYDTSLPWCGIFYNINGADWMDYSTSTTFVRNCAAPTTTGLLRIILYLSRVIRKPDFCICENKDAD